MANYTLTYSENSKGFPSFYSYFPDYMIGMNNYLYSFKNGQLYRHNTNATRNSYYGSTSTGSMIKTVINEAPLDNKLFKTLNLESTDAWSAEILTDVAAQDSTINSTSFEKKEGNYFAYVRTNGIDATGTTLTESDYKSRTVGGLGDCVGVNLSGGVLTVRFSQSSWEGIVSIGDFLYTVNTGQTTATFVFAITNIVFNNATNNVEVSGTGGSVTNGNFCLYAKNSVAESLGVMGHYAEITLNLPTTVTTASELFAIESELMKSYP